MSGAITRPSLCIVNWNGRHHLERSVPAALAVRDAFAEILVVDNGSDDDSVAWLERNAPDVRILRLPENRGAGAARNAAIERAVSDRILLIDNDVMLLPGCAEALSAALDADPRAAAAQAAVLYADRPDTVQYCGADAHYLGMMILRHADVPVDSLPTQPFSCDSLVTCCFMLDRRRVGDVRFDPDILIYFDDHDFALSLRGRGLAILAVPGARGLHGEGTAGMSVRAIGRYSQRRVFQTIRNRWLVLARHYPAGTLAALAPALFLFEAAQLALAVRKGWLPIWRDAALWMWRNRARIGERRRATLTAQRMPLRPILCGRPLPLRRELAAGALERRLIGLLDRIFAGYWRIMRPRPESRASS